MRREWKQIEITNRIFIPFDWKDLVTGGESLGRAEFHVCIKFLRGKISEFWVYPVQTRLDTCWHYSGSNIDFAIVSYDLLERSGAWLITYCKEHKASTLYIYSPSNAKYLEIDYHGISFLRSDPYKNDK